MVRFLRQKTKQNNNNLTTNIMTPIILKGEEDMPTVILDRDNNLFEMSGRSLPEDSIKFYKPILQWLDEYEKNPLPKTEFVFRMTYFNTATAKQILEILIRLEDIYANGNEVRVNWLYPAGDGDMEDAGLEYARIVNVPIIIEPDNVQSSQSTAEPTDEITTPTKNNFVISISRELCAGGEVVGHLLAEKLRIKYFDDTVVEALTQKYNSVSDALENVKSQKNYWWGDIRDYLKSNDENKQKNNENTFALHAKILNDIADTESCVVAEQDGFYMFKDRPNHISIFIGAPIESRISRLMAKENISYTEAAQKIETTAKEREEYVLQITGSQRHDTRNYDIVINMDKISEEGAVDVIMTYIARCH